MFKKFLVALGLTALLAPVAACNTRPPSDMIALYYKAGAGDNKKFEECIEPGTEGKYPYDDEVFYLPTSLRSWAVLEDGGDSNSPFVVGSAIDPKTGLAGPQVKVWVTVKFYLNTDCTGGVNSPIVQFWQRTGNRPWKDGKGISQAGEDGFNEEAWVAMLKATLVPVELGVLQEETRKYIADDLDANKDGVWTRMEQAIGPAFNESLKGSVGGDYFCGSSYNRDKKPVTCPPVSIDIVSIDFADAGIQTARNDVFKAKQQREAELTRAQTELDKANLLAKANRNPQYLDFAKLEMELERAKLELESGEGVRGQPELHADRRRRQRSGPQHRQVAHATSRRLGR